MAGPRRRLPTSSGPRVDDHRGLFRHHWLGQSRAGEADRGGLTGTPAAIPRPADRGGDHPEFAARGWQVLVAPVGTPAPIVDKISVDLAKVVSDPDFKQRLSNIGSYSRAMTPEQVLAFVQKEQETWLPVLQKISQK